MGETTVKQAAGFNGLDVRGLLRQMTPTWSVLGEVKHREERDGEQDGRRWVSRSVVVRCASCDLKVSVPDNPDGKLLWSLIPREGEAVRLSGDLRAERGEKGQGQIYKLVLAGVETR